MVKEVIQEHPTNMEGIRLSDFLPFYPDTDDQTLQSQLSVIGEFAELAGKPKEATPKRGYFNHQLMVQRFIRIYDRLILIHRTGTGKSHVLSAMSEYFHDNKEGIEHVVVLVPGSATIEEIKKQLVCRSPEGSRYLRFDQSKMSTEAAIKSAVTKKLNEWYTISTYSPFANKLSKMSDEEVVATYSNTLFFFDEIHTKSIQPKKTFPDYTGYDPIAARRGILKPINDGYEGCVMKPNTNRFVYHQLNRVCHLTLSSKYVISSATPIYNYPNELIGHFNLILPPEKQFDINYDFTKATVEDLAKHLNGMVSYVRELDTGLDIEYEGDASLPAVDEKTGKLIEYKLKTFNTSMEGIQRDSYLKLVQFRMGNVSTHDPFLNMEGNERADDQKSSVKNDVFNSEQQCSCFVFPDGSYGKEGYKKYVKKVSGHLIAEPSLKAVFDLDRLKDHSIKFYWAVQILIDSYNKRLPGTFLSYFDLVTGSGLYVYALLLEHYGFKQFKERTSVFMGTTGQASKPYCIDSANEGNIRPNFPPDQRYAVVTHEEVTNYSPRYQALMELFNSKANARGEYVKVILISPVAGQGVNAGNVTDIDIFTPQWNIAGLYQRISRGVRVTSHEHLKQFYPPDVRIPVKIRVHAALAEDPNTGEAHSIDLQIFQLAERKDRVNKPVMRKLKIIAWDAQLNYLRNWRETDVDGTEIADYDIARYPTYRPMTERAIDYTNYNILYAANAIKSCSKDLRQILVMEGYMTLTDLFKAYDKKIHDRYIVYAALDKVINSKRALTTVWGFSGLPRILTDEVVAIVPLEFIQDVKLLESNLLWYIKALAIGVKSSLRHILFSIGGSQDIQRIKEMQELELKPFNNYFVNMGVDEQDNEYAIRRNNTLLRPYLVKMNVISKAYILEEAIKRLVEGEYDLFSMALINFYINVFYILRDAPARLKAIETTINNKRQSMKTAEKRKKGEINYTLSIEETERAIRSISDKGGETVYLHSLYNLYDEKSKHGITASILAPGTSLRIYKPSEGKGFRELTTEEIAYYNYVIYTYMLQILSQPQFQDVYGIISADGGFRFADPTVGDRKENLRDISKGNLQHSNPYIVYSYMIRFPDFDIPIDEVAVAQSPLDLNAPVEELVEGMKAMRADSGDILDKILQRYRQGDPTAEQSIRKIFYWYNFVSNEQSTRLFKDYLIKTGRILVISEEANTY